MSRHMKIFVVIVTYDQKKWISRCYESLRQSVVPLEIIVIDNNSNDGTPNIIKADFPEVDLIQSKVNLGFGKGNNLGIKKAYDKGADFVFLLNQDAWIESDSIDKLIKASLSNSEYGILSPVHLNGSGSGLDYNFSLYISPASCPNLVSDSIAEKELKQVYTSQYVNAAAWLLTRKCIEVIGGFSPLFTHYGEDDNYLQRLFYHNFKLGVIPSSRIFHDRDERPPSTFHVDRTKIFRRKLFTHYCNPNISESAEEMLLVKRNEALKQLLKLNLKEFKLVIEERNFVRKWYPEIKKAQKKVKEKGMTYL